jgi:protease-4
MTFFKTILAAAFGFFLALAAVFLFFLIAFGSLALSGPKEEGIKRQSVLRLDLNYPLPEQSLNGWPTAINPFNLDFSSATGLNDLVAAIDAAAKDDRIEGILLDLEFNPNGLTKLREVVEALERFQASGKFVLGYGQNMTQRAYYLGSAATELYLHPSGMVDLKGLSAELSFYTRALEKLGVDVQVFYDGKYKSATEPFRLEQMSPENREQLREFMDEIWAQYLDQVSRGRALEPGVLQTAADSLSGYFARDAQALGLVDGLKYPDEIQAMLREKLSLGEEDKISYVTLDTYLASGVAASSGKSKAKSKIAVIYAEGDIGFGLSSPGRIGSDDLSKLLRKAREDKAIKAVVLRVNSPGGVAPASDMIWREAQLLAEDKTLVVSMGDLAASAGYQISAPADYIVAQPNTLTGSIGVFLLLPNLRGLMEDKLGITSDTVKTAALADFPSVLRPVSERQRAILQRAVDSTYAAFKQHVAEGRGMSVEAVEAVAQGRIWTGTQALERGLVDTLGNLSLAVAKAAELARLGSDYQVLEWPETELSPFEELFLTMMQTRAPKMQAAALGNAAVFMNGPLGMLQQDQAELLRWVQEGQIQARMPYSLRY